LKHGTAMHNDIHLGVNIDHVATLRQARGTRYPDPVQAAIEVEQAGADGFARLGGDPEGELLRALGEVRAILAGPRIQARCLECRSEVPPAAIDRERGRLTGLLGLFS